MTDLIKEHADAAKANGRLTMLQKFLDFVNACSGDAISKETLKNFIRVELEREKNEG